MSNAKKRSSGSFSLAAYQAKVDKEDGDPFVLEISESETITIPRPDSDAVFAVEAAMRNSNSREMIYALCEDDDQAERLFELFGELDARVLEKFVRDVVKFFGLGGPGAR